MLNTTTNKILSIIQQPTMTYFDPLEQFDVLMLAYPSGASNLAALLIFNVVVLMT